jgi:hypothetical protein
MTIIIAMPSVPKGDPPCGFGPSLIMLAYTNLASPVNPPNAVVEIVGVLLPPRVNAALKKGDVEVERWVRHGLPDRTEPCIHTGPNARSFSRHRLVSRSQRLHDVREPVLPRERRASFGPREMGVGVSQVPTLSSQVCLKAGWFSSLGNCDIDIFIDHPSELFPRWTEAPVASAHLDPRTKPHSQGARPLEKCGPCGTRRCGRRVVLSPGLQTRAFDRRRARGPLVWKGAYEAGRDWLRGYPG